MNILQIEDQKDWYERIMEPELKEIGIKNIFHAETHTQAVGFLNNELIDYVILDLSIPYDKVTEPPDIAHGVSLARYIRESYPGTPILVFTGQTTEEAAEELENDNHFTIFWDGVERPLVKMRKKRQIDDAILLIKSALDSLSELNQFEVSHPAIELSPSQKRIIQLFGKNNNAIGAKLIQLDGGLSTAKVLGVTLINDRSQEFYYALAKIDRNEQVNVELSNFDKFIKRLPVASFPTFLNQYFAGCGKDKGIFFQLASKYKSDFFNVLTTSDDDALNLSKTIKSFFDSWYKEREVKHVSVRDVRRCLCSDKKFDEISYLLEDIDWEDFENKNIRVNYSIQHSDLHGKNILVSDINQPIIIDYGDVKIGPSTIDPVTMELSAYFHPATCGQFLPDRKLAQVWFHEDFFKHSNFPKTAKYLRTWSNENKFLDREYIAVVYGYSIRQLTYQGVNKEFALSLIRSAINEY